jgi:DNA polymerase-3 subunit epsilon
MDPLFPQLRLDRPLAFLDLETTALSVTHARIIDIAVLKLRPNDHPQRFAARLNPGVPIPPDATEVHGIRDKDVKAMPTFARISRHLLGVFRDCDLAGYNLTTFDLPVLVKEFQRVGREFPLAGRSIIDVFGIFKKMEPRDLSAAVKLYLGRDHRLAHSAAADVFATAQVLNSQLARYPELPSRPADLHQLLVEVDIGRRFRRRSDGQVMMGFGKYAGMPLAEVAVQDPGYLHWLIGTDLLDDAKAIVRQALAGRSSEPANPGNGSD